MKIKNLDHLVLTVKDINSSSIFYSAVLGMEEIKFGDNRRAVKFGNQKINFRPLLESNSNIAKKPTAGSADICFISETPLSKVIEEVRGHGISIELGPVERTGAMGSLSSIYLRDPDGNLIEISNLI